MDITFMIGNGFDLSCGVPTRYIDMYKGYVDTPSSSKVIEKFKFDLKANDEDKQYKHWADFEMGMADYAHTFSCEDDFVSCIRDFKRYLVEYLLDITALFEKRLNAHIKEIVSDELIESVSSFYKKGLTKNDARKIGEVISNTEQNELIELNFISFNYTVGIANSLIDLISADKNFKKKFNNKAHIGKFINIHGALGEDIILGVDNIDQLSCVAFPLSRRGKNAFIKPIINALTDSERVSNSIEMIKKSSIICVYGLSLGDSDLTWRNLLKEWLVADQQHHIVYFVHESKDIPAYAQDERIDEEDQWKNKILERLGFSINEFETFVPQIHVPIGTRIFNIKKTIGKIERAQNTVAQNAATDPFYPFFI